MELCLSLITNEGFKAMGYINVYISDILSHVIFIKHNNFNQWTNRFRTFWHKRYTNLDSGVAKKTVGVFPFFLSLYILQSFFEIPSKTVSQFPTISHTRHQLSQFLPFNYRNPLLSDFLNKHFEHQIAPSAIRRDFSIASDTHHIAFPDAYRNDDFD